MGGSGKNFIKNNGSNVTIDGGEDNDYIANNKSDSITINSGAGDDFIDNQDSKNISIMSGAGNDSVKSNGGDNVTIDGGDDNDTISNGSENSTIIGGVGDDSIHNQGGDNVSINGGEGHDSITNWNSSKVSITTDEGNDYIDNSFSDSVTINSGAGDDSIINWNSSNVTICAGAGNDLVSLSADSKHFISYSSGDGDDTIWGFKKTDTLDISGSTYTTTVSGDDVIYKVGNNSIVLKNAREIPEHEVVGESGTAGGTSTSNSSSSASGGGSSSSGKGSSGGSGNSGGSGSSGSNGNSSGSGSSSGKGYSSGVNSSGVGSSGRGNTTSSSTVKRTASDNQTVQNRRESKTFTYTGGRRTVSDYRNGDKILFSAEYTGSYYDGSGNFVVGSSSGSLLVKNAVDKVIDLSDAAGKPSIKAYAASNEGVIDGRGIAGFEIINGSNGADMTYAGDGGSSLWGGNGFASDTLVGGAGVDSFVCSKNQGADLILNAAPKDTIYFNDATLSDIVSATENNLAISITFNTGNVVTVRSPEFLSAKFALADGNAYRFNHIARNWQKA